ncbi:MAG: hypothetical protein ABSG50_10515 [Opitutaceae bacterium]
MIRDYFRRHRRQQAGDRGNPCKTYLAEIGIVGTAPGKYNLYLGAKYNGTRLNRLFADSVTPGQIINLVGPLLRRYALERTPGEQLGDFCIRLVLMDSTAAPLAASV